MWLYQVAEYYRHFARELLEQLFRFSLARLFRSRLLISIAAGFAYVGWREFAAKQFYSPGLEDWFAILLAMFFVWVALAILITPVALDTEKRIEIASKQLVFEQLELACNEFLPSLRQKHRQKEPEGLL